MEYVTNKQVDRALSILFYNLITTLPEGLKFSICARQTFRLQIAHHMYLFFPSQQTLFTFQCKSFNQNVSLTLCSCRYFNKVEEIEDPKFRKKILSFVENYRYIYIKYRQRFKIKSFL